MLTRMTEEDWTLAEPLHHLGDVGLMVECIGAP